MFGIMQQHLCKSDASIQSTQYSYCGTCKSIGTLYGHKNRMFLNYDISFLSALLQELASDPHTDSFTAPSCWTMPAKGQINNIFKYTASINVFLAGVKLMDNIRDSKNAERLKWKAVFGGFKKSFKQSQKTLVGLGLPVNTIHSLLEKNYNQEIKQDLLLEQYYAPTSAITQLVFNHGADLVGADSLTQKNLSVIGNSLGALAYSIDAISDISSDRKKGNFNPILSSNFITQETLNTHIKLHSEAMKGHLQKLNISSITKSRYLLSLTNIEQENKKQDPDWRKKRKRKRPSEGNCFSSCLEYVCCESCCSLCSCDNCACDS